MARRGEPERRCIVTGDHGERGELLRFVVAPDGTLVPDLAGRLPGRGIWVKPARALLAQAIKRRLFDRAARRQVKVPDDLGERVGVLLRRRCLDLLGLARRAGAVSSGYDKVHAALHRGEAALLLGATDAADGGRQRLVALGRGKRPDLTVVERFTAAELGAAIGRPMAVHVALRSDGPVERLIAEIARLEQYETDAGRPPEARK
jgi:predicted RNA-binding protein YlxR (DUF448 family)